MRVWVAFSAYAALVALLVSSFARTVPQPYMDEPFHLGQTQAYCAGRWAHWDPKLTTFPGTFACGAAAAWMRAALSNAGSPSADAVVDACGLSTLRALNALPALATPPLLLALLREMHPAVPAADLTANAALLSLVPTHFFFHFLYYTDSAATCSVLLLLLLASRPRGSFGGQVGIALAAASALSLRQTNAVWIAFAVVGGALRELRAAGELTSQRAALPALAQLLRRLPRAVPSLCVANALPLLLLLGFARFVVSNGGVVLGDKANHAPVAHGAQLLYLTAYAAAPFHLLELTLGLPRTLAAAARAARAAPAAAMAAGCLGALCTWATYSHPFLLADNRHVTFYLWRHLLGRGLLRYALLPAYLLLAWLLYPAIWRAQGPLLSLALVGCCALVLVPAALIEPRYLTLPLLLLRLHTPPLLGPRRWLPPLLALGGLNVAMLHIFLRRPYAWADGSTARFMW